MGGGGAMRTAAKLAGIGVSRTGFRGPNVTHPVDHSVRNASRPVSSTGVLSQGARVADVSPIHTTASGDLSDWEFADSSDLYMSAGEPVPRVVFGDVPTLQEAKEATAELKDAIDQVYLSSGYSQGEGKIAGSEVSVLSPTVLEPETKSCIVEAISNPSVPKHAIQAFQLLSKNAEAQTVVASIACDPNIWNAVMQNPAVTHFFESQLTDFEAAGRVVESTDDAAVDDGSEMVKTPEKEENHESHSGFFSDIMGLLQSVKLSVTEMVGKMSNFLQNIFPAAEKDKFSADADGAGFMDYKNLMGGTFMGLAVMAIMVILMKRA